MNRTVRNRAHRTARPRRNDESRRDFIKRLSALLQCPAESSNAERIRQIREAYFADVDALEKSGTVVLPE